MSGYEKFIYSCFVFFGLGATAWFGFWWFEPGHISHNFGGAEHIADYALFILLSYVVWHEIAMGIFVWYVVAFIKHPNRPAKPAPDLRVAYLTAFVPGAESYEMLKKTLQSMVEVDYPHDTWLLDEGDDPIAKEICVTYGIFHYSRKGKTHFNTEQGKFKRKTKGGNYNSWLHQYGEAYDIIAQHDVDFIPQKDFLTRTLGFFKDPKIGFVGTPQIYGNTRESWIAQGAAEQTWGFYGFLQKGFYGQDMTLLIGANHLFRVAALKEIDGYTAHITEDMLTGMKFYTHRWKSVYVPEILLLGEGPSTWSSYFSQQMRWAYGCLDITLRHSSKLLSKMSLQRVFNYIWLQQYYFVGLAQLIGIILLSFYFLFGLFPANMTVAALYLWVPLMGYQVLFQRWLQRFNIDPKNESGMMWRGRIMFIAVWPVYLLAFFGAISGKKLSYVVTPKGQDQPIPHEPSLFIPHFIIGSVTLFDIFVGELLHHQSPILLFWAALNTLLMYGLFFSEALPPFFTNIYEFIKRLGAMPALDPTPRTPAMSERIFNAKQESELYRANYES